MPKIFLTIFYSFILLNLTGLAQTRSEMITVIGDSLVGKVVNGEAIREIYGKVVLKQGDVRITCNKAIQFISRNDAELIGNVVATQDSLTITTSHGFYYGNLRKAFSYSGVELDDKKVILTANNGEYFFDEDRAYFTQNVTMYDTATTLTSGELTYFKKENRAVAVRNVKIIDNENEIVADSLEHFRSSRVTNASRNVKITNFSNNIMIFGHHLLDYAKEKYTIVDRNPLLIQIDTSYVTVTDSITNEESTEIRLDTLIIKSLIMEAFRDTLNIFKAIDSVEIVRGDFSSRNNITTYFRDDEKIVTNRINFDSPQPILWYDNSQLSGDSITVYLRNNKIMLVQIDKNSFILSQHEIYKDRFDQISGERTEIYFNDGEITGTEVEGNVLSIYYLFEGDERNGLTKSAAQNALIIFEDKQVAVVKLYGTPTSEYYPENQVEGKELSFTLPAYFFIENRPTKEQLVIGYKLD
jgi:lipopolysaccharide export system protein LptA